MLLVEESMHHLYVALQETEMEIQIVTLAILEIGVLILLSLKKALRRQLVILLDHRIMEWVQQAGVLLLLVLTTEHLELVQLR